MGRKYRVQQQDEKQRLWKISEAKQPAITHFLLLLPNISFRTIRLELISRPDSGHIIWSDARVAEEARLESV